MFASHDWSHALANLGRVALAFAYILIALDFIGDGHPDAKARVLQGILAGLGFIGGGAILKGDNGVRGTASAATIWVTGAIGVAVAGLAPVRREEEHGRRR